MVFNSSPPPSWNGCLFPLHFLFVSMLSSIYLRYFMFFPAILMSACDSLSWYFNSILCIYSHKQVTIASFTMLLSVLKWSIVSWLIQFLRLDSFKGGFNFYFLKNFPCTPLPFLFDVLHEETYVSNHGSFLIAPIRPFPVLCVCVCTTLCFISQFRYWWSLAWEILSITLVACEMRAIVQKFWLSLALPLFGIGMKTDLFQSCGHC